MCCLGIVSVPSSYIFVCHPLFGSCFQNAENPVLYRKVYSKVESMRWLKICSAFIAGAVAIPRPVLLDCDPGGDDVFAIMLLCSAHRRKVIDLVGVTTAAGNHDDPNNVYRVAYLSLQFWGCGDVPVSKGESPGQRESDGFFGADGLWGLSSLLGDCSNGACGEDRAPRSADTIAKQIKFHQQELVIVATGPLTNLALAERNDPGVLSRAREVVIMGGAVAHEGNAAHSSEYNIWFDGPSSRVVFLEANIKNFVIFPLDATQHILFGRDHITNIIRSVGNTTKMEFLDKLWAKGAYNCFMHGENSDSVMVHDIAPVLYLFYPSIFTFNRLLVNVDNDGRTWADLRLKPDALVHPVTKRQISANAWVAVQVDSAKALLLASKDLAGLITDLADEPVQSNFSALKHAEL